MHFIVNLLCIVENFFKSVFKEKQLFLQKSHMLFKFWLVNRLIDSFIILCLKFWLVFSSGLHSWKYCLWFGQFLVSNTSWFICGDSGVSSGLILGPKFILFGFKYVLKFVSFCVIKIFIQILVKEIVHLFLAFAVRTWTL